MPRVNEDQSSTPEPTKLPVHDGYLHMHWTTRNGMAKYPSWHWEPRERYITGICETVRCVIVKLDTNDAPIPCDHEWVQPPWCTMWCKLCGKYHRFDVKMPGEVHGEVPSE